ncbi:hypothetical protein [Desulfonema limicola]|nr:hypothetical protein [Desulfonema limicola]
MQTVSYSDMHFHRWCLTRKSADFQQVANYEKDYKRYNHSCTADDGKDH